ncbi:MAG: thiamine phosphate synthase [Desulfotomaculaceae bacterium]|nr:thiamine phosphate synthase [Desulfotomaculaceae bacterium]MDD4766224.1 thiamine phosphate synthase [Desulfotomaculaceae bacterium]
MFKRIVITNRNLCERPFLEQLERIIKQVDMIVLREKDLPESEYGLLAREVLALGQAHRIPCVLHTHVAMARRLGCTAIHLPLPLLEQWTENLSDFTIIGSSVHSVDEARRAQSLGADYLMAGHVFATDCKKGLPPRGLAFLKEVCEAVSVPVYALGGITEETEPLIRACGAKGACRMSDYMKG